MSKKRIAILLLLGVVIATTLVFALNVSAQAQSYGDVGGTSASGTSGTSSGGTTTGAEVLLFGLAGAGLIGAGYFLTRKAKA